MLARISTIENENNNGLISSLNKGLQLASGEYIARMDCDDVSNPTRLMEQVNFLDANPLVAVVATKLVLINEDGEQKGYWNDDYFTTTAQQIKNTLPIINCIGHPSVMMRTNVIKKIEYSIQFC